MPAESKVFARAEPAGPAADGTAGFDLALAYKIHKAKLARRAGGRKGA